MGAKFEFGTVKGSGQVELSFFSDDDLVEQVLLDVQNKAVDYDLMDAASFDEVKLELTDNLRVSVTAFEFERLIEADAFAFV